MKLSEKDLPPPGLQGDYCGSCVVCLRGTDTALGFAGEAEFAAAGLVHLGVDQDEAVAMVEMFIAGTGADIDKLVLVARVCGACAGAVDLPVRALPDVPLIQQKP